MQSYTSQQHEIILNFIIKITILLFLLYLIQQIYDKDNETEFTMENIIIGRISLKTKPVVGIQKSLKVHRSK